MPLAIAVLMDPIRAIKPVKDTTFAMLLEASRRGHRLYYLEQGDLASGASGANFGNIQVEVILPEPAAERLLERLHAELFPLYAMIAHATEVRVLRADKF